MFLLLNNSELLWIGYSISTFLASIGLCLVWFYRKASPQEAIVRSGWGGLKVAQNRGIFCFPILHEYQKVPLQSLQFNFDFTSNLAPYSKDQQQFHLKITLYVRIENTPESILRSTRIGLLTQEHIFQFLQQTVYATVRNISSGQTFEYIDHQQEDFAKSITKNLQEIFSNEYGLKLDSVAITQLEWIQSNLYRQSYQQKGVGITELWNQLLHHSLAQKIGH